MSFTGLLNSSIKTYNFTKGAGPAFVKTWALNETLDATVHKVSGGESVIDIGKTVFSGIRAFIKTTTAVVGERIKYASNIYEIVHVDDPMGRGRHVELKAELLPNEDLTDYPDA
jgi:head-tail adaptor